MFGRTVRTLRDYFGQVLQDINGYPSSKRWALLLSVVMITVSWVANLFWKIVVDEHVLDAIKWIGGGSGLGIAAEYIKGKKND